MNNISIDWTKIINFITSIKIDWTNVVPISVNIVLAALTYGLLREAINTRKKTLEQQKEIAFRAALVELIDKIAALNSQDPNLHIPATNWWIRVSNLPNLTELLRTVWVDLELWERIVGLLRIIEAKELRLVKQVEQSTSDPDHENNVKVSFYSLDLYLKQLARYLICEMQRQGLKLPKNLSRLSVLQIAAWTYGELSPPPQVAAQLMEAQILPVGLPPEPTNSAFQSCTLAALITEARNALAIQGDSVRELLKLDIM